MIYLIPVAAYLLGSISSAVLAARAFGLDDPRGIGSGNPGATNILRQGAKSAAALTLLGDILKGLIPVAIARGLSEDPVLIAITGAAAFLGHLFPVFFGFRGGKGVATGFGVYLGLDWVLGLCLPLVWLTVAGVFRYSSLAAMVTAALSPLLVLWLLPEVPYIVLSLLIAGLLLWRHRGNFQRLLSGQEDKISFRRKS